MKSSIIRIVAALAVVFSICFSCGCPCLKNRGESIVYSLKNSKWQMINLNGKAVAPEKDQFFINFDEEGALSGRGNCNNIMAQYVSGDDKALKINNIASTRMMCPDMQDEADFTKMLESVTHYSVDGKMLMLFNNGAVVSVFQKLD